MKTKLRNSTLYNGTSMAKTQMAKTQLTLLNSMAGHNFACALDRHVRWGLHWLDLKGAIFGKGVLQLSDAEAVHAAQLITARRLKVYCLSTSLFDADIEDGPDEFTTNHLGQLSRLLRIAEILQPRLIRLLAAHSSKRDQFSNSIDYIRARHPWILSLYGEAIDRLTNAGWQVTIENEARGCILAMPEEIIGFFDALERQAKISFTWDVQNLWQMGVFPTLDVYRQLKPLIGYYHLKGGRSDGGSNLVWASALEDASWPVLDITRQVVADGISPVICLNPSHGAARQGYNHADIAQRDLNFLRREMAEIE